MKIYPTPKGYLDLTTKSTLGAPTYWPSVSGSSIYFGTKSVRFLIETLSDDACFFTSYEEAYKTIASIKSRGKNAIRLHHIDQILSKNPKRIVELMFAINAISALGMRVFIDLYSKRGEDTEGVDKHKVGIIKMEEPYFGAYLNYTSLLLSELATNKTVVAINLVNESMHLFNVEEIPTQTAFYSFMKDYLTKLGYGGLIMMNGDSVHQGESILELNKYQDLSNIHFYGDHPSDNMGYATGLWTKQPWQWGTAKDLGLFNNNPTIVEEVGDLFANPHRCANIGGFLACEFSRYRPAGIGHFLWASNKDFLAGSFNSPDTYCYCTDDSRMVADWALTLLFHYDKWVIEPQITWDTNGGYYSYKSEYAYCEINTQGVGYLYISTTGKLSNSTNGFLLMLDNSISRYFESVPNSSDIFWKKIVNKGTLPMVFMNLKQKLNLPIGTKTTTVYDIDIRTGDRLATVNVALDGSFVPVGPMMRVFNKII